MRLGSLKNRPLRPTTWDGPFSSTTYVTFGPKKIQIFGNQEKGYEGYYGVVNRGDPHFDKDIAGMLQNLHAGATLGQVFDTLRAIVLLDAPVGPWREENPTVLLGHRAGEKARRVTPINPFNRPRPKAM